MDNPFEELEKLLGRRRSTHYDFEHEDDPSKFPAATRIEDQKCLMLIEEVRHVALEGMKAEQAMNILKYRMTALQEELFLRLRTEHPAMANFEAIGYRDPQPNEWWVVGWDEDSRPVG